MARNHQGRQGMTRQFSITHVRFNRNPKDGAAGLKVYGLNGIKMRGVRAPVDPRGYLMGSHASDSAESVLEDKEERGSLEIARLWKAKTASGLPAGGRGCDVWAACLPAGERP